MFDRGISREGDLIDLAIEDKIVDKSGAWINYGELRLGQGRENAKQYLRDNPALMDEITKKVLLKRGLVTEGYATPLNNGEMPEPKPEAAAPAKKGRQATAAE